MKTHAVSRLYATAVVACLTLAFAGCAAPPPFQVTQQEAARVGRVESITQDTVQNVNSGVGTVGGALLGAGLGSLVGGGRGQTAATIVGAAGGAYAGNQAAQRSVTFVWRIAVRYDDGTTAVIQQTTAPSLRVGDRVGVTSTGIQRL